MNKYIPTMFKRIYTSMILALALSVSVTIILSNEYLERDAIVDFQRDTNYIYKKLSETWEREELSASEYFNLYPLLLMVLVAERFFGRKAPMK